MPIPKQVDETPWVHGGKLITTKDMRVDRLAFNNNGSILVGVDGMEVHLMAVPDLAPFKTLGERTGFFDVRHITSICFDPTDCLIAAGCSDKTIRVWEVASGQLVSMMSSQTDIESLDFGSESQLVSVSAKDKYTWWEVRSGKDASSGQLREISPFGMAGDVDFGSFSPDRSLIATGKNGFFKSEVKLWEASSGSLLKDITKEIKGAFGPLKYLKFNPTMNILAIADESRLILYDTTLGVELPKLGRKNHRVLCRGFSPDGKLLALSQKSLWEDSLGLDFVAVPSGEEIGVLLDMATCPAVFISSSVLLLGGPELIHLVDVLSHKLLVRIYHEPGWPAGEMFGMTYHPKGLLATRGKGGIALWGPGHNRTIGIGGEEIHIYPLEWGGEPDPWFPDPGFPDPGF